MKLCSFCNIHTKDTTCPHCYAIIPEHDCHPVSISPLKNEYNVGDILTGLTPLVTTAILKNYKGPAWVISLSVGTLNALYTTVTNPLPAPHPRSAYYIHQLLELSVAREFFNTPKDFKFCKKIIKEYLLSLSAYKKNHAPFSEILTHTEFRNKLKSDIHINSYIPFLPALFELIATQNHSISVSLNRDFKDDACGFQNVVIPSNVYELYIEQSYATSFDSSLWNVQKKLTLKNFPKLKYLPENENTLKILEGLHLHLNECGLIGLPHSIAKRFIFTLDLENCQSIHTLAEPLESQFKQGIIQHVNFRGTNLPSMYQKVFARTCLSFPDEIFKDMPPPLTINHLQKTIASASDTTDNLGKLFIPCALIFLTIIKALNPKKRSLVIEKGSFWGMMITLALGTSILSNKIQSCQIMPKLVMKESNIDSIYLILQKSGMEIITPHLTLNWDNVWNSIFKQDTPLDRPKVPECVLYFIESWIEARNPKAPLTNPLTIEFDHLIQRNGGQHWARTISNQDFNEMINTIDTLSVDYKLIQKALIDYRRTIGTDNERQVTLRLNDILSGSDCHLPIQWSSLFSFIQSGQKIDLTLDWSYQNVEQPLDFIPTEGLSTLYIKNATLKNVSDRFWLVYHELTFENCKHFYHLPKLPQVMPRSPLKLVFINCPIRRFPDQILQRQFKELVVINCPNLYFITDEFKDQIEKCVLKKITVRNSGLKCSKEEYINDMSILKEPIFEQCPPAPLIDKSSTWLEWINLNKWYAINWIVLWFLNVFLLSSETPNILKPFTGRTLNTQKRSQS